MPDQKTVNNRWAVYTAYVFFVLSAVAVNFLAKWGSADVDAIALSGMRLTTGGLILFILALCLGVGVRIGRDIWRYALVALTAIALPQAILFAALSGMVTPNDASLAEATIPGIVFFYQLAQPREKDWLSGLFVVLSMGGLVVFLLRGTGQTALPDVLLLLLSAAITAAGLLMTKILPSSPTSTLRDKLMGSLQKNVYVTCIAGVATLVFMWLIKPDHIVIAQNGWSWILALALIGTCLGWGSLFLLLAEDVLMASSAIIAIPIVTAAVTALATKTLPSFTEMLSAILVVISLSCLVLRRVRNAA
jgi:drug/metabolite transporter (DMT)-like permease